MKYRHAILVKYLGPTTFRGPRLSVRWADQHRPIRYYPRRHEYSAEKDALLRAQEFLNGLWEEPTFKAEAYRDWAISMTTEGWIVTFA